MIIHYLNSSVFPLPSLFRVQLSVTSSQWWSEMLSLYDTKPVLHATLQLSNHYISINTGRLPYTPGATGSGCPQADHCSSHHICLSTGTEPALWVVAREATRRIGPLLQGQEPDIPRVTGVKWDEGVNDESEHGCCCCCGSHTDTNSLCDSLAPRCR